jgi:hypothetical protein
MKIAERYGVDGFELRDSFIQATAEFVAEQINRREGIPATPARVAVQSGLTQSETKARLQRRLEGGSAYARRAQALSAILNAWHSDAGYAGVYDLARDIPFSARPGIESFSALCEKYGQGFSADSLLEDLVSAKCVDRLEGGYLRPQSRTFVLPPGDLSRLDRMGKVYVNFGEAFLRILAREDRTLFRNTERTLVTDFPLSVSGARAFDSEVRERGTKFLTDLDTWLTAHQVRLGSDDGRKYGCGLYFFEDVAEAGSTPFFFDDEEGDGPVRRAGASSTPPDRVGRSRPSAGRSEG